MNDIEFLSCDGYYFPNLATLNRWNITTGEIVASLNEHLDSIYSVCSSNDGTKYATCSNDKTARIYDRKTNKCIIVLEGHESSMYFICFSRDDIYSLANYPLYYKSLSDCLL